MTHDFPTIEEVIAMHDALKRKPEVGGAIDNAAPQLRSTVAAGELIHDISGDRSDLPQIRKDIWTSTYKPNLGENLHEIDHSTCAQSISYCQ